jgi:haloalkane dehalogenase
MTNAEKKTADIFGKKMSYLDVGEGDPIVFLHGNPTSSYLWRNIIPHVSQMGRCVAPDLIGQGDSDKLDNSGPDSYKYVEHRKYLFELLKQIGVESDATFVIHDWGSALGFDWAMQNPDSVKGVCYMEAIVKPFESWDDWPENARGIFQGFRSESGEDMALEKNLFVEGVLPAAILRDLEKEEMNEYRRPFSEPGESRRPTLTWPREIPIEGFPEDVTEIVTAYAEFMSDASFPKLFINAEPGAILQGKQRDFCRQWKNQTEITVAGNHFIQEDSPDEIGTALSSWFSNLPS